jgi:hypothetical protein
VNHPAEARALCEGSVLRLTKTQIHRLKIVLGVDLPYLTCALTAQKKKMKRERERERERERKKERGGREEKEKKGKRKENTG